MKQCRSQVRQRKKRMTENGSSCHADTLQRLTGFNFNMVFIYFDIFGTPSQLYVCSIISYIWIWNAPLIHWYDAVFHRRNAERLSSGAWSWKLNGPFFDCFPFVFDPKKPETCWSHWEIKCLQPPKFWDILPLVTSSKAAWHFELKVARSARARELKPEQSSLSFVE